MRKPVFGVSNQVQLKRGCTATKMVRGLNFQIDEVKGLYHLCSESKCAGQLHSFAQLICAFVFT